MFFIAKNILNYGEFAKVNYLGIHDTFDVEKKQKNIPQTAKKINS